MKRCLRKWQVGMLLVLCLMILLPASAMASSGIYVPVEGTITLESGGKTLKGTIRYSYKNDGRISSYSEIWPNGTYTETYQWKKGFVVYKNIVKADGNTETNHYYYKNGYNIKWESVSSDSRAVTAENSWDQSGRTATYVQTYSDGHKVTGTVKVNKKKQVIQETISRVYTFDDYDFSVVDTSQSTYTYYKDGKTKSDKKSGTISWGGSVENDIMYNKAGYITSYKDRRKDGTTRNKDYRYTNDRKKKCPKKVVVTETSGGNTTVKTYVFTKFKKVSRVRNCDDSGFSVPLGANW